MFNSIYSRTIGALSASLAPSSPRTTMSAAFAKKYVDDTIAANKIVIFSKSYCPYCRTVKNLFASDFAHLKGQIYVEEYVPLPSKLLRS